MSSAESITNIFVFLIFEILPYISYDYEGMHWISRVEVLFGASGFEELSLCKCSLWWMFRFSYSTQSSHCMLIFVSYCCKASEPQQGCVFDFPSRNIISRETSLSGGLNGNGRLPVPVLLAKERLLQRLRGVSVSGSRFVNRCVHSIWADIF